MIHKRMRTDAVKINCRGYRIDTHKIPNMPETLTRAFIMKDIIYFSDCEPIAIKFSTGVGLMTFKKLGGVAREDRINLRWFGKYKTIMEIDFNGEIFKLLSQKNSGIVTL